MCPSGHGLLCCRRVIASIHKAARERINSSCISFSRHVRKPRPFSRPGRFLRPACRRALTGSHMHSDACHLLCRTECTCSFTRVLLTRSVSDSTYPDVTPCSIVFDGDPHFLGHSPSRTQTPDFGHKPRVPSYLNLDLAHSEMSPCCSLC
jgi:hypothetical protein